MKKYLHILAAAAITLGFASCSDDDEPNIIPDPEEPAVTEGIFVLNQGNYGAQIEGSLTFFDNATDQARQSVFQQANGVSLGSTPQCAIAYGSKIYIGVFESNVIQVIDKTTFKSVKMISLANEKGQSPRSMVAKDDKVYISMFNGYVSRLDTASLTIDNTVQVGPNPEIMAIRGNYLYVPNSDGLNWQVGYGTTASKINLSTFSVEKTFTVGLNPAEFATNGSDLFLLCKGNYYDIPSAIYRIDDKDESAPVAEATMLTVRGNKLHYINAPFGAENILYGCYDIESGAYAVCAVHPADESPAAMAADPASGNIVVTYYTMEGQWANYLADGYACIYDESFNLVSKFDAGVGPCAIFFTKK